MHFKEDNALSLRKIHHRLRVSWNWFLICMISGLAAAWAYLHFATPAYNINAKILVQGDPKSGGQPASGISAQLHLLGGAGNVDNEVEILCSRSLMEKVVRALQLNISYWTKEGVETRERFENMPFSLHWIAQRDPLRAVSYEIEILGDDKFVLSGKDIRRAAAWGDTLHLPEGILYLLRNEGYSAGNSHYRVQILTIDQTVSACQKMLTATIPNNQVSTIALSLIATIPAKGEMILNKLIGAYLETSLNAKNRIADSTICFLDQRLKLVVRELTGVEKNMQRFKASNELADLDLQTQLLLHGANDFTKRLNDHEVRLSVIDAISQYIENEKNNQHLVPSSLLVQDPVFTAIVDKRNLLQLERERLLMTTTTSNPLISNIDWQLASLRKDIQENLASLKQNIRVSIHELQQKSEDLNREINHVPEKERILLDYSRQREIQQELYLFLLKKREESAIARSSNLANARIIDVAKSEALPFQPDPMLVLLSGLLLGMATPALWCFLKSLWDTRVRCREDVTGDSPLPVLGEIGHTDTKGLVVVKENMTAPVVEQFRSIRTNLQFLLSGAQQKTVLLTSSMGGEGKSFVAINLAAVLALSGKKVVLMEMDLRKPKISEKLRLSTSTGFSTYAIGQTSLDDLIRPSGICENCSIVSSGPIPPNPGELLLLGEVDTLFTRLRDQFDYIIIDTAPIGMVTDAQLLARWTDTTLYLVRQRYTFKQQLEIPKELYLHNKLPKLNLIINDNKIRHSYGYG